MTEREKKYLFAFVVLATAAVTIAFSTLFSDVFTVPKRFFLRTFVIPLVIIQIYLLLKYGLKIPKSPAVFLPLSFFVITLLSWTFSKNPAAGTDYILDLLCLLIIYFVVLFNFDSSDIKKFTQILLFTGLAVSAYALMQRLGLDPVQWAQDDLVRNRSISTLGNPNFLSAFLVMLIPVFFALAMNESDVKKSISYFLASGLMSLVNLLTYSRTGLLAMVAALFLAVILLGRKILLRDKWKVVSIVLIIVFIFLGLAVQEKMKLTRHSFLGRLEAFLNKKEINVATRLCLWQAAGKIFISSPLIGTGPGTFGNEYLKHRYLEPEELRLRIAIPESSHNLFLDVAYQSGFFALAAFIAFLIFTALIGFKFFYPGKTEKTKDDKPDDNRAAAAGYSAGIVGFITAHLAGFSTLPTDLLFWIFTAFVIIMFTKNTKELKLTLHEKSEIKNPKVLIITIIILSAAGLFLTFENGRTAYADLIFQRARNLHGPLMNVTPAVAKNLTSNNEEAISKYFIHSLGYYNQAVKLAPKKYSYWQKRGKLLESYSYINKNPDLNQKLVADAAASYEKAAKLNPGNPYPYADEARLMGRWGVMERAEKLHRKAVSLDPWNQPLTMDYAIHLARMGKNEEAEKVFLKAIKIVPDNEWAYGNYAIFLFENKEYDKAQENFIKALERVEKRIKKEMKYRGENPIGYVEILKQDPTAQKFADYLRRIKNLREKEQKDQPGKG